MTTPAPATVKTDPEMLIILCTAVAVLVLLIDWKIKQDIVKMARTITFNVDRYERLYYASATGDPDFDDAPDDRSTSVPGGTGVASEAHSRTSRGVRHTAVANPGRTTVDPGSGDGRVEVPASGGGMEP